MRGEYTLLLTGLAIFLTAILKYHSPQLIEMESFCDPKQQICAHCPVKESSNTLKRFNDIDSIVRHHSSFGVLFCDKELIFVKKSCADFLELVNAQLQFEKNNQILQNLFQNKIYYEMGQKYPFASAEYYYFLQPKEDFVIFTKQDKSQKPKIYKQSDQNGETLFFFAKIINQSALIALAIATILYFIGFSCFSFDKNGIPLLQILILSATFIIYKHQQLFRYLQLTKAVFLLIISTRMINEHRYFKAISIVWLLSCFLQQKCLIIGCCYLFHQIKKRNNAQFKQIISIIFVVFVSMQVLSILPLSFISYSCMLWSAIFLPILLLVFEGGSALGTSDSFQ